MPEKMKFVFNYIRVINKTESVVVGRLYLPVSTGRKNLFVDGDLKFYIFKLIKDYQLPSNLRSLSSALTLQFGYY